MAQKAKIETSEGMFRRLRRGALCLLFATVLVIPKIIAARRQRYAWNRIRLAAAALGAAAITGGLTIAHGNSSRDIVIIGAIAAGVLLAALALLVGPDQSAASPSSSTLIDLRARELGALVVVDGGEYVDPGRPNQGPNVHRVEVRLFVGSQQLGVLDTALNTLLEIPITQIATLRVERVGEEPQEPNADWKLHVAWKGSTAEFVYRGPFGEHLARVAESTIGSQLRRQLPVLR
jgi:hypothetical protein